VNESGIMVDLSIEMFPDVLKSNEVTPFWQGM
jgi:hypothetical protein